MAGDTPTTVIADRLASIGQAEATVRVSLSNELLRLLSEQLYHSPTKAIEELVVNAFDAGAKECYVFVPPPDDERRFIVVFDNGIGMNAEGLHDLWLVGTSRKRVEEGTPGPSESGCSEATRPTVTRRQIGKFGIGKLATYAIAHKVTYLTRRKDEIHAVSVNFEDFRSKPTGPEKPVEVPLTAIKDWDTLRNQDAFVSACSAVGADISNLLKKIPSPDTSWTFCILEDLKEKLAAMPVNRLRWVLSTAMPLAAEYRFKLFLNGHSIESSKDSTSPIISFAVSDISDDRLAGIAAATSETWDKDTDGLISRLFPSGIRGSVIVTERTLVGGKSDDLFRSHGFFVRVRGRVVNEDDAHFGMQPLTHQTINRFRAELTIDDLDEDLSAPREGVKDTTRRDQAQTVLRAVFNEARSRYEAWLVQQAARDVRGKEHERAYVDPMLVEGPIADVLLKQGDAPSGPEADESWFYLRIRSDTDIRALARTLYNDARSKYSYKYDTLGSSRRIVLFDPSESAFTINENHEFVRAYKNDASARLALEDMVTAEAMLEVYLRDSGVQPHVIGEVLERRDQLLRSLALDHPLSLELIARSLRESGAREHELERQLIRAARALGFVTTHIGDNLGPDGVARYLEFPGGERKIILEAKSSEKVPGLGAIDFATLRRHVNGTPGATGCLLLAPDYPGSRLGDGSAVAETANQQAISCWTVEQLARVVEAAERRHFTARHVIEIVSTAFAPTDVARAVDALFETPAWDMDRLYRAVLEALEVLQGRESKAPRTVDQVWTVVSGMDGLNGVDVPDVHRALSDLAAASQGELLLRRNVVVFNGSHAEIVRRVSRLSGQAGDARGTSTFRRG